MPKLDLGRVVGRDGGFGNVTSEYFDDGGEPSVDIEMSGEDTAKDFKFILKNLVNKAIDSSTISQILNGSVINSSKVLSATGLTTFFSGLKDVFAPKSHTHGTAGIEDNAVTAAKIAPNCIGKDQLETSVWDSISQTDMTGVSQVEIKSPADGYIEYYFETPTGTYLEQIHKTGIAYFKIANDGTQEFLWFIQGTK